MVSVVKDFDTKALIPNNELKYPAIDTRIDLYSKYIC